jgi:hypothetical protein
MGNNPCGRLAADAEAITPSFRVQAGSKINSSPESSGAMDPGFRRGDGLGWVGE